MRSLFFFLFFAIIATFISSCSKDKHVEPISIIDPISINTFDFETIINENPENGQSLGFVRIETESNSDDLSFGLTAQEPEGAFAINTNSGELTVTNSRVFDYEETTTITGTFTVSIGSITENASIIINLTDMDDTFYGDVSLTSQLEVDAFGENHFRHITGYLRIGSHNSSNQTITNLSPLDDLQSVDKSFSIIDLDNLIEIIGFNNLKAVGRGFGIFENINLETINGFENLKNIGDNFSLQGNFRLINLPAFSALQSIEGDMYISSNSRLLHIDGFNNLSFLGRQHFISGNNELVNIDGFQNIPSMRSISINNNPSLLRINGYTALTNLDTSLYIFENNILSEVNGFNNLKTLSELIIQNTLLTNLDDFNTIGPTLDYLYIRQNNSLTTLSGLSGISVVESSLIVDYNNNLVNFEGLDNLISCGGIIIDHNDLLQNFDSLASLNGINYVRVLSNPSLLSLLGLQGISVIGGGVEISNNIMLQTLNGMENIISISEYLYILENDSLYDFCALQTLFNNQGVGQLNISLNAYNPSQQDIINGNCSL